MDSMRFQKWAFILVVVAVCLGQLAIPAHARGFSSLIQLDYAQRHPITALDLRMPELLAAGSIPGVSMAVIADRQVEYCTGYGVSDIKTDNPVNADTVFSAASLSKPVFAYTVMRLVDRGEFDLDASLASMLPNPRLDHDPRYKQITARMVLSHTSGLPNWGWGTLFLKNPPGTKFNYSGEGMQYLQEVLEHVTGLTLHELVTREVFEPLGMERSAYYWQDRFEGNAVSGHGVAGSHNTLPNFTIDKQNAAYSLLTTAEDYGRFVVAVANGTGLSPEIHNEMLSPQTKVPHDKVGPEFDNVYWGLGWGLQKSVAGDAIWHWGNNGIYMSYVAYYPESGTGLVYFSNSDNGLSIVHEMLDRLVPDDHMALKMLNIEDYDAPGREDKLARQKAYIEGDISAGEGIFYEPLPEKETPAVMNIGFLDWIYDTFFS